MAGDIASETAERSATDRLVDHCVETTFDDLSPEVREGVGKHLLDWLGLVVGATEHAASTPSVLDGVAALGGAGGEADARSVATGERLPPDRAALLDGTLAHSLDFDDTHRASSLHPGAPVVAAALPLARTTNATTAELATAIAVGYDVACAMGRAVNPDAHYGRGFHITATCGTFGATAAAGRLLGLDADGFRDAFGVNGSQAAGSLQFLENGAWNKRLHPGLAASRGVLAASLADAGFRGAADPIEGRNGFFAGYTEGADPAPLAALEPGRAVLETALKPYPCCRYIHAAIDGLLDIAAEADVDPGAVDAVRLDLPKSGVALTGDPIEAKRRPENFVDCQFSAPFAAALALSERDGGLRAFLDAQPRLDDPALRRLMGVVEVTTTERTASLFPDTWAAGVEVEAGGERYERFVEHARGEPESPLSWETATAKFEELTGTAGVAPDARTAAVDACRSLAETDAEALFSAVDGLSD